MGGAITSYITVSVSKPLCHNFCSVQQSTGPGEEDNSGEAWGGDRGIEKRDIIDRQGHAAGHGPLYDQAAEGKGGPGEELNEE